MKTMTERTKWMARHALAGGRGDHGLSRREAIVVASVFSCLVAYLTGLLFLLT